MRRPGQSPGHVGREAVARHHVEARCRQEDDAGRLRRRIPGREGLQHRDLAGDVDVVRAGREAGLDHRPRRPRERAGRVDHRRHARERRAQTCAVVEARGPHLQAQPGRQRPQLVRIAPRQDRAQPLRDSVRGQELPGIAGGAVDQDRGHPGVLTPLRPVSKRAPRSPRRMLGLRRSDCPAVGTGNSPSRPNRSRGPMYQRDFPLRGRRARRRVGGWGAVLLSLTAPAWAADGPVTLVASSDARPGIAAMPQIAAPADEAERRINAALKRLDARRAQGRAGVQGPGREEQRLGALRPGTDARTALPELRHLRQLVLRRRAPEQQHDVDRLRPHHRRPGELDNPAARFPDREARPGGGPGRDQDGDARVQGNCTPSISRAIARRRAIRRRTTRTRSAARPSPRPTTGSRRP